MLVSAFGIPAPVRNPTSISERHVRGNVRADGIWQVYDKRYLPDATLEGHLGFALRHETIELLILKRVLRRPPTPAATGTKSGPPRVRPRISSMWNSRTYGTQGRMPISRMRP